jgi:hypothetical protein
MKKTFRFAASALGVLALGLSASGLMVKASLADLAGGAELILLGRVIEARSSWSLDNSLIVTLTTIEVRETIKGRAVFRRIAVQTPGGQVGDLRLTVSDEPVYEMLDKAQGKYSIGEDGLARKAGYRLLAVDESDDTALPLIELTARIKTLLRRPAAARRTP